MEDDVSDFDGVGLDYESEISKIEVDPEFEERRTKEFTESFNLDSGTEENSYDPFDGGTGTNMALLITNMRIYDVLMALYAKKDDDGAAELIKLHADGKLLCSLPTLSM